MPNDNDSLKSILLAAATLVAVLVGSFLLASTYLTEDKAEAVALERDCLAFDGCRAASEELKAAYSDPDACQGAGARVCLVPMGDIPKDTVDMLVEHYRKTYALTIQVARPLDLRLGFDRDTQLEESLVLEQLWASYRRYGNDRSVTLIGLVPVDIYAGYVPSRPWSFGRLRGGTPPGGAIEYWGGIISIFRLDPLNAGLPPDDALRDARLRKLVSKYIAFSYFDLPVTNDPRLVTSNLESSLEHLDMVDERIPLR